MLHSQAQNRLTSVYDADAQFLNNVLEDHCSADLKDFAKFLLYNRP